MSATASKALDPYKPFPSLRGQKVVFTSSSPFTPTYVRSHTPSQRSAYTTRVEGRQLLLENPARESRRKKLNDARKSRQKQDKMKRRAGILSRREAKLTGAWKLGKRDLKCVSSPLLLTFHLVHNTVSRFCHPDINHSCQYTICGVRILPNC